MDFNSKKGAIAVYAFLAITVLIALVFTLYLVVSARYKTQLKSAKEIKEEVAEYIQSKEVEIIENPTEIYLYQQYQYDQMNSNKYVYIPEEDKIYKFTTTAIYLNQSAFI